MPIYSDYADEVENVGLSKEVSWGSPCVGARECPGQLWYCSGGTRAGCTYPIPYCDLVWVQPAKAESTKLGVLVAPPEQAGHNSVLHSASLRKQLSRDQWSLVCFFLKYSINLSYENT